MNKIPVGDTIAEAYSFTFGSLGVIIGLIWLPMVLIAVGGFTANLIYTRVMDAAVAEGRIGAQGQAAIAMFAWSMFAMLLYSIVIVAVTRQALGLRKGPALFHFALGTLEFRSFVALLGFAIVMCVFAFGILLVFVSLFYAGSQAGGVGLGLVAAYLALIAGIGFLIYIGARLGFLLFATVVAEEKGGLQRAWTLSQGNFWRIFLIGLATIGPLLFINDIIYYQIVGAQIFENIMKLATSPALQDTINRQNSQLIAERMPYIMGLSLLLAPFSAGLSLGGPAFAYRALTAPPKTEMPVA
ncbi:MAG TPA: hypothetical protein VGG48_15020 [Rhizomicrobium sp.]